jgi:alpha-D-ribose 1-methylphosphonate 5-triphosphate synthase subunit PhnI
MYVAVKGGERAIEAAHRLLAEERRGELAVPELTLAQIEQQLALSVDRVMSEGSLYDRRLAALAIKQSRGDLVEAIFLLRAYRTTLPRFGVSGPLDTARMRARRRISATFKDVPGGQLLGPTFDYTHRLLDAALAGEDGTSEPAGASGAAAPISGAAHPLGGNGAGAGPAPADAGAPLPRVIALLDREGLIEGARPDADDRPVGDLTRSPLAFPAARDVRLQMLARGDEGFLLALGYSTQRGYGRNHPFAGEIRMGEVAVELEPEELGFAVSIADVTLTECEMVNQFTGSAAAPPQFTRGYGLAFGEAERKAMAMALVDRALRGRELGEEPTAPAQDEEFVLYHADNVEASGFVQHLKLPHHVDFQAELVLVRRLRAETEATGAGEEPARVEPQARP